jgi:hypothetical protein
MSDKATADGDFKLSANIIAPPSCGKCHWAFLDGQQLTCRRNPPQQSIIMAPLPQGPLARPDPRGVGVAPATFAAFPNVQRNQWCGEFRLDIQKMS